MGTTLIVKGTLRGMGCEVECSLIATRSEAPKTAGPTFTKCAVLDAPNVIPDGYYEATFSGHSAFLHRTNGVWSVGVPWHHVPADAAAVPGERETPVKIPSVVATNTFPE